MTPRRKKTRSNGEDLHARLATLRADLEALRNDVKGLAGEAGDAATSKMNEAINDAMESVQELAERAEDWGDDHLVSIRESVREQPLASCALAMGAGALLGAILFRR